MLSPSLRAPENNLCVLGEHSWNMTSQQSPHGALGMYKNMEVTCSIICFLAQHVTTKQHHKHHGSSAICIEISVCANQAMNYVLGTTHYDKAVHIVALYLRILLVNTCGPFWSPRTDEVPQFFGKRKSHFNHPLRTTT